MNKSILLILISFSLVFTANSQLWVKGKILDLVSRQPLQYANISQDGNFENTTFSDLEGNFSIKVSDKNAALVSTFIGYKSAIVKIEGKQQVSIELQRDIVNLKDVVLTNSIGHSKFNTLAKVDLDVKPVKNTQELLRLVPGLFVAQHAGGGKAEQIFLRGFDCDHGTDIEVTVDGMPVNMVSHAHGHGYADAHFIIPETINNIDYGTGPYYAEHGNLNTAGYVSFSTFKNIANSQVQFEVGKFNTFRTLAMFDLIKKNKDKQSAYIASEYNYTNGPTVNAQNFNRFNVFGKYNLAISSNTQLTASLSAFKSKWDASGQVPVRAIEAGLIDRFGSIDPTEGGNTERYNANIQMSHSLSNGSILQNQFFFSRNIFSLYSNFTFFLNDSINGDGINQAEKRNVLGFSSRLNKKSFIRNWSFNSIYGTGIRFDATTDSYLSNTVKRTFLNYVKRGDIKELNAFIYTQQQVNIGKWLFEGGVRIDYFNFNYFNKLSDLQEPSQSKAIVSPKLNLQYTVSKQLQVYGKAGKGFHSNDTRVVVANKGRQILPAAYGADLGVILKPAKNLLFNIAAWYLYLDQEFVYVGDDGNIEPSGKTQRHGIDIIARYQITQGLVANVNFNFTRPVSLNEPKGTNFIPLAPTVTSTGGIFYKKKQGFNGGLNYRFIKDRPANEDNSIIAKGYFMIDGSVNYSKSKYEVGLAVENLLNVKWNEAQFATESRLLHEPSPVTELNFTPGTPFFIKAKFAVFF